MLISEAACRTGLTISNIRFYERKGLLVPEKGNNGKYRDYSEEDTRRLKLIILYRKMGMSIETINQLLKHELLLKEALSKQKEELIEKQKELQGSIELCNKLIDDDVESINVDYYLSYMKNKESQGKKFAAVEELIDDVSAFWKLDTLKYNLYVGKLFSKKGIFFVMIVIATLVGIGIPITNIITMTSGNSTNKIVAVAWAAWVVYLFISFGRYRTKKRK